MKKKFLSILLSSTYLLYSSESTFVPPVAEFSKSISGIPSLSVQNNDVQVRAKVSFFKAVLHSVCDKNVLKKLGVLLLPAAFGYGLHKACSVPKKITMVEIKGNTSLFPRTYEGFAKSHGMSNQLADKSLNSVIMAEKEDGCIKEDQITLLDVVNCPYFYLKYALVENLLLFEKFILGFSKHIPYMLLACVLNQWLWKNHNFHVVLPYGLMNGLLVLLRSCTFFYNFEMEGTESKNVVLKGKEVTLNIKDYQISDDQISDDQISFDTQNSVGNKNVRKLYGGFWNQNAFVIDTVLGCLAVGIVNILLSQVNNKK
jgi:hypothetical protein